MSEKGQSLVEVMIALGVSLIIITTIVASVVLAVVNSQFAKTQNLATNYARQGMEIVRQISRTDWETFDQCSCDYCLAKNATELTEKTGSFCEADEDSNFRREVKVELDSEECNVEADPEGETKGNKAEVIVSWNDGRCAAGHSFCHQIKLNACFQNINTAPDL